MKNKSIEIMIRNQLNLMPNTQVDVEFTHSIHNEYFFDVTVYLSDNSIKLIKLSTKMEVGELDDCECTELGSICDHCEDDV